MNISKAELVVQLEAARRKLNESMDEKQDYEVIYQNSVALDRLIELYIVSGF